MWTWWLHPCRYCLLCSSHYTSNWDGCLLQSSPGYCFLQSSPHCSGNCILVPTLPFWHIVVKHIAFSSGAFSCAEAGAFSSCYAEARAINCMSVAFLLVNHTVFVAVLSAQGTVQQVEAVCCSATLQCSQHVARCCKWSRMHRYSVA